MRGSFSWLTFLALLLLASGAAAQPAGDGGTAPPAVPSATSDGGGTGLGSSLGSSFGSLSGGSDAGGELTGEQYLVRLRDLEQRINELKEEIFRSKARLSLLAESVLQNVVGGSRAIISHQNEMGASFQLVSVVYSLDGAPIFTRTPETGRLSEDRTFPVYNGQIGSGDHTLGTTLEYLGAGLPYMKGYRFRVRSSQSFSIPEGKAIVLRGVAYEKGGPFDPPENRPAIRYVQRIISLRDAADLAAESEGGGAAAGTTGTNSAGGGEQGR
jgi:hypothetical protein